MSKRSAQRVDRGGDRGGDFRDGDPAPPPLFGDVARRSASREPELSSRVTDGELRISKDAVRPPRPSSPPSSSTGMAKVSPSLASSSEDDDGASRPTAPGRA